MQRGYRFWILCRSVFCLGGRTYAAIATDRASFSLFLFDVPDDNTRMRDASTGGTSTTVSPEAMSCCDRRCPRPVAASTAHTLPSPSTLVSQSINLLVWFLSDRELTKHRLIVADRDRCVGRLVRIDTNRRDHHQPPLWRGHIGGRGRHS